MSAVAYPRVEGRLVTSVAISAGPRTAPDKNISKHVTMCKLWAQALSLHLLLLPPCPPVQALHGLHAKLDSLAAQMLEYISRHYAQFGRHPRAQPTPGPSVQAEGPQQQPEQEQQQRRRRPEQQQQLHQQHKPPQRSPAARQLPLDELAGSVVRADD